jgi:hypothetical protein
MDAVVDSSLDGRPVDAGDASDARSDSEPFDSGRADSGTLVPEPPPGRAVCGGVVCAEGEECCLSTSSCFDPTDVSACVTPPRTENPEACASNEDCAEDEYCDGDVDRPFGGGLCGGVGTCRPMRDPSDCGGYRGVCGCDGRTYADPCEASRAGVRTSAEVPCGSRYSPGEPGSYVNDCPCPPGYMCDEATDICLPIYALIACGTHEQCPSDMRCCGITGTCVDADCPECCTQPPEGTFYPCRDDSDCIVFDPIERGGERSFFYCDGPGCGPAGGCARKEGGCSGVLEPVCGCDGMTYVNECTASEEGVRIASTGECP